MMVALNCLCAANASDPGVLWLNGCSGVEVLDLLFQLAQALHHFGQVLHCDQLALGLAVRGFDPEVRVADPTHGDFQANGALALAKRLGRKPT